MINDWAFVIAFGIALGCGLFLEPEHGVAALLVVALAGLLYL